MRTDLPGEAVEIATTVVRTHGLGSGVREALLPMESSRLPALYGVDIEDCWIVHVEDTRPMGLRSGIIVAVDRDTGRVSAMATRTTKGRSTTPVLGRCFESGRR